MFRAADRQILNVIVTPLALVPFLQLKFRTSQFLGSIAAFTLTTFADPVI